MAALVKLNIKTLAFCKVRAMVELVLKNVHDDLRLSCPALVPHVKSYRGGYNKDERRRLEQAFFGGQVTTSTYMCKSPHITSLRPLA